MAISRELVFKPAETRISIRCKSCKAEVTVDLIEDKNDKSPKEQKAPARCPSCFDEWVKIYGYIGDLRATLNLLNQYDGIVFRVAADVKGE